MSMQYCYHLWGQNLPHWEPWQTWLPITVSLHLLSDCCPPVMNYGSKDEDSITSWKPQSGRQKHPLKLTTVEVMALWSGQQSAAYLTLTVMQQSQFAKTESLYLVVGGIDHSKKKWVVLTHCSYLSFTPHDWTNSLAKYSPMPFANVLKSQIKFL